MNPFCGWGYVPRPAFGFLLGLAAATVGGPSNGNPFCGSLFTNPFVYNTYTYQNDTRQTAYNPTNINFGSLTASTYYNDYPDYNYNNFYQTPSNTYDLSGIDFIANNIANNIRTAIETQGCAKDNADIRLNQVKLNTIQPIGVSNESAQTTVVEDYGKSDLKPGLFKGRLAGKEALVTKICHKYGVSPALVASIIGLESGWGTSNLAMHNNFGGYRAAGDLGKNEKGFGYFSTIEKGLEAMIKNLAGYTRYRDVSKVDFNNLDNIGRHYCEGGVWAGRVRNMYNSRVRGYLA
jgi:hypothetical protein